MYSLEGSVVKSQWLSYVLNGYFKAKVTQRGGGRVFEKVEDSVNKNFHIYSSITRFTVQQQT